MAVASVASCYSDVQAPECVTLADCPSGYTSCEEGFCFKAPGVCDPDRPVPGDGCCSETEGDRSADTDCMTMDLDLEAVTLTTPASDGVGGWFVSGTRIDAAGASWTYVWKVGDTGEVVERVKVGGAQRTVPAVVSGGGSVYASYDLGVVRLDQSLAQGDLVLSGRPAGGLCATPDPYRPLVVWVTEGGRLFFYDEDESLPIEMEMPESLGRGEAFAPVVSGNGRRMYVAWKSGVLLAVEVKVNPLQPIAVATVEGGTAGPPIESGGVVFVPLAGGKLAAYHVEGSQIALRWTLSLGGDVAGRVLSDESGALVAVLRDGGVRVVRDQGDIGKLEALGSFGEALADVPPLLASGGRIVAIAEGGGSVVSMRASDGAAGTAWVAGVRFDAPVPVATPLALASKRLVYGTASGRLAAWLFPDDLAEAGFAKDGGDAKNRGAVRMGGN
jgi:hypothetical protein